MNTWAKYSISFFVLVLILTALIFSFGPRVNRDALRSGVSPVGQLPSDSHIQSNGMGVDSQDTSSATTRAPADR